MKKNRIALHRSRLGMRMIGIMLAAFTLALSFQVGLSTLANQTQWGAESIKQVYGSAIMDDVVDQLQQYVTNNHVASTSFSDLKLWVSQGNGNGIGFLYGQDYDPSEPYSITFADKKVSVYPYMETDRYRMVVGMLSFWLAMLLFVLLLTPYIRRILSDITHLSDEMDILSGGDLSHEIKITGNDELASLGRNIEAMRQSVNARIQSENEAVEANHQLVTQLSHDLRTPLTKELGYLELLMNGKAHSKEEEQLYLSRAYHAACQVRERSDSLFNCFSVTSAAPNAERMDGTQLFLQLADEMSATLEEKGFQFTYELPEQYFEIQADPAEMERIFENLTSNMVKYADTTAPITLQSELIPSVGFVLTLTNRIAKDSQVESHRIGLTVIEQLMRRQGGSSCCKQENEQYQTVLTFHVL